MPTVASNPSAAAPVGSHASSPYLGRPWGFGLADVQAPVALWWGKQDHVTPPSIARDFARRLPDSELHLVDGTHQLLFARWREILAAAAQT